MAECSDALRVANAIDKSLHRKNASSPRVVAALGTARAWLDGHALPRAADTALPAACGGRRRRALRPHVLRVGGPPRRAARDARRRARRRPHQLGEGAAGARGAVRGVSSRVAWRRRAGAENVCSNSTPGGRNRPRTQPPPSGYNTLSARSGRYPRKGAPQFDIRRLSSEHTLEWRTHTPPRKLYAPQLTRRSPAPFPGRCKTHAAHAARRATRGRRCARRPTPRTPACAAPPRTPST